jgi:nitrite reductase (NADH) large subunit
VSAAKQRQFICALDDVFDGGGVCAIVAGEQVALFRVGDEVFALENLDPWSGANVLSRGILGDLQGQLVVASPVYKQHFNLRTGRCLEDDAVGLKVWPCGVLDGRVWVEAAAQEKVTRRGTGKRRLVVIGNGMAAMRTVEELVTDAPDVYDITVFGAEPRGNYNRILLSPLLAGDKERSDLELHSLQWYADKGIAWQVGDAVVSIDRKQRRVISASGVVAGYDRLLLATGSDPMRLKVKGQDLPGIFYFRSLDDVDQMLGAARDSRTAVVIGGGLLGLEAAYGLKRQGLNVTVIHLHETVMDRQLDAQSAGLLRASLEARGIQFYMSARTQSFEGDGRVQAVHLENGDRLETQMVVIAAGIRPRTDLARSCGLHCDRGILVDDTLQTFDPSIYAVGECVQHRGTTYGLVAPLWEQARVCAAHLAERGVTRYRGSLPSSQLKVTGVDVFSAGELSAVAGVECLRYVDNAAGIYKRMWVKDNRLVAAILYGDASDAAQVAYLIENQRDISTFRQELLLGNIPALDRAS